jgi:hypothetical protein
MAIGSAMRGAAVLLGLILLASQPNGTAAWSQEALALYDLVEEVRAYAYLWHARVLFNAPSAAFWNAMQHGLASISITQYIRQHWPAWTSSCHPWLVLAYVNVNVSAKKWKVKNMHNHVTRTALEICLVCTLHEMSPLCSLTSSTPHDGVFLQSRW